MKIPEILSYDTDTGNIHYVSNVLPDLEIKCRVNDAVRYVDDLFSKQKKTPRKELLELCVGQFLLSDDIQWHMRKFCEEAVAVSNKGMEFLQQEGRKMTGLYTKQRDRNVKLVQDRYRLITSELPR